MKTYIVLLRGINVGGRNILPMKELVALLEGGGFNNIKTYIQSGNIVLQSKKKPGAAIGKLIEEKFGFRPAILVLEESELISAIENNPFDNAKGNTVHFSFCGETPVLKLEKLDALAIESEQYQLIGKVFYLYAPDGIGRSKLAANIESCLGVPTTARNLNTVNKLKQMLG